MKSEVLHVRIAEIYMWKLRGQADLRSTTPGRLAKMMLEQCIGDPTEEEIQRYKGIMIRMGREEEVLDPISAAVKTMRARNLRRGAAPSVAERERKVEQPVAPEPPPIAAPARDRRGWLICPDCGESSMIEDGTTVACVAMLDPETGYFTCHRKTCGSYWENPAYIGLTDGMQEEPEQLYGPDDA